MSKVDFFIVGAPKSGTTALYHYLNEHNDIFLPAHKEPNYFAFDYPNIGGRIKTLDQYKKLYDGCKQQISGDASVCYLSSKEAPKAIYEFNSNAKIVIMLRKPIDLFLSEFSQLRYSFYESENDPYEAWSLQVARSKGKKIPKSCRESHILQYKNTCALGSNVERYLALFPKEQVCIIFFEDFLADTLRVYKWVLKFLGVDYDGKKEFPVINKAKTLSNSRIAQLLISPPGFLGSMHAALRRKIAVSDLRVTKWPENLAMKFLASITKEASPPELNQHHYMAIQDELVPEVEKLEQLLGRDLSAWKT